jgi:predicted chitinase
MDLTFPIQTGDDAATEADLYSNNEGGDHGFYPVGRNHFWHGGVHLNYADKPLLAVADGEVIAYRMNDALQEYKGPDPTGNGTPPADGEAKKYYFSNGFVLVRHKLLTPMATEIQFYALYMHLKPMTAEETEKEWDIAQPPFIFQKTHYMVATDADGGGMPIIDNGGETSLGVIPFGSQFTVHPNDDKCKNERYRKIRHFKTKLKGYVLIDAAKQTKIMTSLKSTKGRILEVDDAKIYNESRVDTARVIPKKGFFTLEEAPAGHFSKKFRYEQLVYPKAGPVRQGFITAADLAHGKTVKAQFRRADAPIPMLEMDGSNAGAQIRNDGDFAVTVEIFPPTHWTQKPENKPLKYKQVEYYENALIGYAIIEPVTAAALKKTGAAEHIDLVDESGALLGDIPANKDYLAPAVRPPAAAAIATIKYEKIEYPDPTNATPTEGYAFLRMGYDVTHLDRTTADTGKLYLWGENGMSAYWSNPVLAEGAARGKVSSLDDYEVFELMDDTAVPAGHWSTSTGWRLVTYEAEARQGQAALSIDGYCFVDTQVAVADGAAPTPTKDQKYKLLQKTEVDSLIKAKNFFDPPDNATIHYRPGHGTRNLLAIEKKTHINTRPWNGQFNGANVREKAAADSKVLLVLEQGRTVKFKDEVKFKSVARGSGYVYAPDSKGYYELSDAGFAYASDSDVTKRAELPKPIEFNKVVALATPIPIKRGDIVGFGGTYLTATNLAHFEIFTPDRDFTNNANHDHWGTMMARFDPAATANAKEALPVAADALLKLPPGTSVRVNSRDSSEMLKKKGPAFCNVSVLGVEGWLKESDLKPLSDPPPDPVPDDRELAAALDKLFADTKKVKKKDKDGHDIEVSEVEDKGNSHAIPGKAGQSVHILEHVDDVYRVKYAQNEGKSGWIGEDKLDAATKDELDSTILATWYTATAELTLQPNDPARNFKFAPPKEKAAAEALQKKLAALPKVKVDGKDLVEVPLDKSEDVFDKDGSKWVGINVGGAEQAWLKDSDVQRLSKEYDWLPWRYVQEVAQPDKPDTRDIDESKFSQDGFCDIDYLLEQLDVKEPDKDGKPTPRWVKEKDMKTKLAAAADLRNSLHTLACVHPTEWDFETDTSINKWERLKVAPFNMKDTHAADYDSTIAHIKEMQWWDSVTKLPDAKQVWNFHPVGFIANLKRMPYITKAKLLESYGASAEADITNFIEAINDAMQRYQINTPLRQAHFLAQVGLESGFFHFTQELGADEVGRNYEGRRDLGNVLPGDGRKFIGRGLIQITGRSRYTAYEKIIGEDITSSQSDAEKVSEPRLAADSAGWFWVTCGNNDKPKDLNTLADGGRSPDVVKKITEAINGGVNHLGRRMNLFLRIIRVLHG